MRISDWSSDVCSSDLGVWTAVHPSRNSKLQEKARPEPRFPLTALRVDYSTLVPNEAWLSAGLASGVGELAAPCTPDRTSVLSGKSVSVRVDPCGRLIIKKKK